ncbi:MAG: hypothetical protein SOZ55_06790 [Ruminococcus sp.]|nr:hypothetical protein [Ruminococcus sp.]
MKKFISTLTSIAMSASLTAGALAVPFAGSALTYDKTYKTLTIESEKTTISASEIAAGDVTVKCDVYFEETPDTDGLSDTASITAMMTCEGDTVKMDSIDKLFADREQYNYTIQNGEKKGTTVICTTGLFFVGTIAGRTGKYTPAGDYQAEKASDKRLGFSWTTAQKGEYIEGSSTAFPVATFYVTFEKGTPAGDYKIDFINEDQYPDDPKYSGKNSTTQVGTHDLSVAECYDNLFYGGLETKGITVTVEGDAQTTTTAATPTTTKPAATTTKPAATTTTKPDTPPTTDKLQWSINKVTEESYKAGDVVYVDVFVTNAWGSDPDKEGIRGLQAFIDYDKDAFELVEIGESCYGAVESSLESAGITVTLSNSTGLGTIANEGDTVTYYGFKIKDGAKDGTYPITWIKDETKATIHPGGGEDNTPPTLADVDLVDGSITLGNGSPVVTTTAPSTTTPTPTTTKAPTTTATTTTKAPSTTKVDPTTPSTGTVLYGDTNCDGKVNIADVVILNKYLTNPEKYPLTAQGVINAEVDLDDKLTTNDSYCIIRSVVKLITLPYKG